MVGIRFRNLLEHFQNKQANSDVDNNMGLKLHDHQLIEQVIELRKNGKVQKEIATTLQISIPTVSKILKKNLPKYKNFNKDKISPDQIREILDLRKEGKSIWWISENQRIGISTIHYILRKHLDSYKDYNHLPGKKITKEIVDKVVLLNKEMKLNQREIAKSLHISEATVSRILNTPEKH